MSGTSRYEIDIIANNKAATALGKTDKQLKKIQGSSKKVNSNFNAMKIAAGAAAAAFAGFKLGKAFLDTAKQFEQLNIQLKFITGSAEDGAKALKTVEEAAGRSAFSLEDMANAAPLLLTVSSIDQLSDSLDMTGDIAAATGLSFEEVAGQLQRAMSGGIAAADMFREKGVKSLLGFQEGVQYTAEQTEKMIREAFENGTTSVKGAAAEMALTFTGQVSMMGDAWLQFKKTTMESGLFPALKKQLGDVQTFLDKNKEAIDEMAVALGEGLAAAVLKIADAIKFIAKHSDLFLIAAKGLVLLKLAGWAVKAAMAMRTLAIGMAGVLGMSGVGWAAVATGLAAVTATTLAMNKAFGETTEEFDGDELEAKIKSTKERLEELRTANSKLEKDLVDSNLGSPMVDFTIDIDNAANGFDQLGDQIIKVPDLVDGITDAMMRNSAEVLLLEQDLKDLEEQFKKTPEGFTGIGPIKITGGPENEIAKEISVATGHLSHMQDVAFDVHDEMSKNFIPTITTSTDMLSHMSKIAFNVHDVMAEKFIPTITTSTDMLSHMTPVIDTTVNAIDIMADAALRGGLGFLSFNAPVVEVTNTLVHATDIMGEATEAALRLKTELEEQAFAIQSLQDRYDPLSAAMRKTEEDLVEAAELFKGREDMQEYKDLLEDIAAKQFKLQQRMDGTNKAIGRSAKEFKKATEDMRTDSEKFVDGFNDDFNKRFADGLVNGTLGFETFAGSLKSMLSDLLTDFMNGGTLFQDIMKMFGGLFGGGSKPFDVMGLFGGGMMPGPMPYLQTGFAGGGMAPGPFDYFADGGRLGAGKMGIAGEAGPELITGPANILSNKESFGNGGDKPQINITIQAIDTQTGTEFLLKNRKQVEGIIQSAYNKRGKQGIY